MYWSHKIGKKVKNANLIETFAEQKQNGDYLPTSHLDWSFSGPFPMLVRHKNSTDHKQEDHAWNKKRPLQNIALFWKVSPWSSMFQLFNFSQTGHNNASYESNQTNWVQENPAPTLLKQFRICLWRRIWSHWRKSQQESRNEHQEHKG